jgi:uncharacterized protein (DUF58 family)
MRSPRQRLDDWWQARLRPVEQWPLTQNHIYIVPTRAGLAFAATLLLLLASINYQLNLGYALTFALAGSALASMHMTHGSLRGLVLHLKPVAPCHAGEAAQLALVVDNPGAVRHGLGFGVQGAPLAWAEVGARTQTVVQLAAAQARRGRHALPLLRAESRFPFGLFRAWTVWRPAGEVWVYPRPEHPAAPLPAAPAVSGAALRRQPQADADHDELRPWRPGDSPRQLLWRKFARSGELVTREQRSSPSGTRWLDWQQAGTADVEARLSRLAAWALAAEAVGAPWGLRLPGQALAPARGAVHLHEALRALAAWQA